MIRAISNLARTQAEWLIQLAKSSVGTQALAALVLMLLIPATAVCQLRRSDGIALSPKGTPVTGATIAICSPGANVNVTPCSPLSSLFSYSISNISAAAGMVTVTTGVPHGLSPSAGVVITGVAGTGFNGTFPVASVPTATTFIVLNSNASGSGSGGAVTGQNPVTSDQLGNYVWFAAPGKYIAQISSPQLAQTFVQQGIIVPCDPTATCTFTSGVFTETTAPAGVAGTDLLWGDSTAHRLKLNNNNGGADVVVGAATTDTLTNKTFDTAGAGNVLKINGTQVSSTPDRERLCWPLPQLSPGRQLPAALRTMAVG